MSTPACPTTPNSPFSIPDFRSGFPEFGNQTAYPDDMLTFWSGFAWACIGPNALRWGNMLCYGLYLLTAHNISQEANALATANAGGQPGITRGPISSETPGQVSLSYDTGAVVIDGEGDLNLSRYGIMFARLVKMRGAGPIQCNIGFAGDCFGAWPGPGVPRFPGDVF